MPTGFEKMLGCLAASQIGSAMGAAVEGWSWQDIQKKYGVLEQLLEYEHYRNGWQRPPGTTEDGIERQRVFLRAIRRVGGRITADDVAAVWREEVDAEKANWCMEPFDRHLIRLAKAGVPGEELGRFNPYTGLVSLSRSCHPIGLVNAGDPQQAARDAGSVGRVLQQPLGDGLAWASVVAAGIAAAMKPDATVESVLAAAIEAGGPPLMGEIRRALELAERASDPVAMREKFDAYYCGHGTAYAVSHANEVVSKALAIFRATGGSPRAAVVAAVNFGRDTDCLAAVAGGLAGALAGPGDLVPEWIAQVDAATEVNPYTNLKLSLEAQAYIVWDALEAEGERAARRAAMLAAIRGGPES
jgi:ADP-ribosylglycohydrolase